jgi:hypothetical protein
MGWCTTSDLDRFLTAAGRYLMARAAENTLLLSAAQAAQEAQAAQATQAAQAPRDPQPRPEKAGPLYGWWEPPDGSEPRGAFLHNPSVALLIAGRAPEMAATLAASLSKAGRAVWGVDAPTVAADAFAAAWSQRAGVAARVQRHSRVYRLAGTVPEQRRPFGGPAGLLRAATWADRELLVAWIKAFTTEVGELATAPETTADELLCYGGAAFWEADGHPVAMATITRPVAGTVRLAMMYTPPERRHNGYAGAVVLAVSQAALRGTQQRGTGQISEVVMITEGNRPDRIAARIGYELISERTVLRFGAPTGPMPRFPTGAMPRLRG